MNPIENVSFLILIRIAMQIIGVIAHTEKINQIIIAMQTKPDALLKHINVDQLVYVLAGILFAMDVLIVMMHPMKNVYGNIMAIFINSKNVQKNHFVVILVESVFPEHHYAMENDNVHMAKMKWAVILYNQAGKYLLLIKLTMIFVIL